MAEPHENPAAQFARRRLKNLAFFQRYYPAIFNHFKNYALSKAEVVIIPEDNDVDLWIDGRSLYQGKAQDNAKREVEAFRSIHGPGKKVKHFIPPWPGAYNHPRFAHRAVDDIIRKSPLKQEEFDGYPVGNFYPLIVFLGCGLGYQIENLVMHYEVENAIVFEPDCEVFAASLFTTDWEAVCTAFRKKKGRSISFFLGVEMNEEALWRALANQLYKRCPLYPAMTLFLNHRRDAGMLATVKRIRQELPAFLSSWGHYDDEVRRLNNAIHGFHIDVPAIPPKGSIQSEIPVLVVGSGPSIDDRLEDIRAARDKVIIISAGSGLDGLLRNNIVPHCHLELDPDYSVYRRLSAFPSDQLEQISFIGIAEVCPLLWNLFGDRRFYFKYENPMSKVFDESFETIKGGNPTCTNAVIAVCAELGLTNIFLFGTDYGFKEHSKHHSAHSAFENNQDTIVGRNASAYGKQFSTDKTFTIDGVDGDVIHTTSTFFGAKRQVEELIRRFSLAGDSNLCVYNCSDGARIEGTHWLAKPAFSETISRTALPQEQIRVLRTLFSPDARHITATEVDTKVSELHRQVIQRIAHIRKLCKENRLRGKKDLTHLVSQVGSFNETPVAKDSAGASPAMEAMADHLLRGTVRHYLTVGFCHAMALESDSEVRRFLADWQSGFMTLLSALPKHLKNVIQKTYRLDTDPLVTQTLHDVEEIADAH